MSSEAVSRSSSQAARELLIDTQLPRFEARSFYAVVVDATPEVTYRAVRALDPGQVAQAVPAMQLMGWFRALPARISARHRNDGQPAAQAEDAFVPVAEEPGREFVVAMIGKFSSPTELEFRRFEPAEFAGFSEAGFGKVAVSFLVLPWSEPTRSGSSGLQKRDRSPARGARERPGRVNSVPPLLRTCGPGLARDFRAAMVIRYRGRPWQR